MKNLFLGFIFLLFAGTSMAQSKVGFVDVQSVIQAMPNFPSAQQQLNTYAESLITPAMKSKGDAIEAKYKTFQEGQATMGDARKEVLAKEIEQMERELSQMHAQAQTQQKLAQKQQELFAPIEEEAGKTIEEVAKANGYSVVFDISQSPVVYADQASNMMPLIKAKLGK